MSRPGSPSLDEAQQPAWARAGTHVLLPRLFYYELANLLRDAQDDVEDVLRLLVGGPGVRGGVADKLDGLLGRLREAAGTAARHARNSGVY